MLLKVIAVLCLIGVTFALPIDDPSQAKILRNEREDNADGSYRFYYETSDGQKRHEQGNLVQSADSKDPSLVVSGYYSYIGPDGVLYSVVYVADKFGFRPEGAHLPSSDGGPSDVVTISPIDLRPDELPPPSIVGALPPKALNTLLG